MIILDTLANVNWTNTGHLLVCFNNSLVLSLGKKPFRFYSWYQWSLVTCANQRIFGNLVVFLVGICTNWVLEKDRRKQPDVALQWSCPKLCVLTLRPLCVFFLFYLSQKYLLFVLFVVPFILQRELCVCAIRFSRVCVFLCVYIHTLFKWDIVKKETKTNFFFFLFPPPLQRDVRGNSRRFTHSLLFFSPVSCT